MDGDVPEICSIERKKFLSDLLRYERAIQDFSRVLSEDFHRLDLPIPQPQPLPNAPEEDPSSPSSYNRQRSFSCAEAGTGAGGGGSKNPSLKSSPSHDRYNGVWGGMDLHTSASFKACTPTKSSGLEHSNYLLTEEKQKQKQRKFYSLSSTGIAPKHLKAAGYTAEELRLNGFTAPQLIGAGTVTTVTSTQSHSPLYAVHSTISKLTLLPVPVPVPSQDSLWTI
jgi:hypothetical protein